MDPHPLVSMNCKYYSNRIELRLFLEQMLWICFTQGISRDYMVHW